METARTFRFDGRRFRCGGQGPGTPWRAWRVRWRARRARRARDGESREFTNNICRKICGTWLNIWNMWEKWWQNNQQCVCVLLATKMMKHDENFRMCHQNEDCLLRGPMRIDITIPESWDGHHQHRPSTGLQRQGQADSLGFPEFLAMQQRSFPPKIEGMDSPWKLVSLT